MIVQAEGNVSCLIALGANLPSPAGVPRVTLARALDGMRVRGWRVVAISRFYRTAPVPPTGQPDFVNAVARVEVPAALRPEDVLDALHEIERKFGRTRRVTWEARTLDLDLLDAGSRVQPADWPGDTTVKPGAPALSRPLALPHPRLHERAFVLYPLRDAAPGWRHPVTGASPDEMIAALGPHEPPEVLDSPGAGTLDATS
ncbi:2-amino-4-hydroxy-6-hydroxymethyldihydropteridine diphosphokinase [Futiania mangrovi]|uniref:2-amino-4-hydroxy-6-hydroxymethyldihydropteridine pyrophosphokinase n=1 Tax=Futiania mangrovi TaxID=2959716 RepID=A0A9J6PJ64_9PROT|nr:2-amino-4-hydroxy-6-hydroxymethyldihydropteridine diphosphokinase [Futiania mangrovii]MCP1336114.1 2-amino-4-hydroxy-6-hydroxymethyldihydropteridine diphosphokinase [Futiania mangrovii]